MGRKIEIHFKMVDRRNTFYATNNPESAYRSARRFAKDKGFTVSRQKADGGIKLRFTKVSDVF